MDKHDERAEKILMLCNLPVTDSAYRDPRNGLPSNLKNDVTAQIREAVEEEARKQTDACNYLLKEFKESIIWKARTSALEEAAKIAESRFQNVNRTHASDAGMEIAAEIRVRATEMK